MFSGDSRRLTDPLIVAVLAATVSLAGASRPSFWYDEAATISASYSRSLAQLWQMLGNVDAVEGLYYLAQEHANREVGAGEQAYDVKVGSMATPLVGDDSRQSWPSTYKVRQSR